MRKPFDTFRRSKEVEKARSSLRDRRDKLFEIPVTEDEIDRAFRKAKSGDMIRLCMGADYNGRD